MQCKIFGGSLPWVSFSGTQGLQIFTDLVTLWCLQIFKNILLRFCTFPSVRAQGLSAIRQSDIIKSGNTVDVKLYSKTFSASIEMIVNFFCRSANNIKYIDGFSHSIYPCIPGIKYNLSVLFLNMLLESTDILFKTFPLILIMFTISIHVFLFVQPLSRLVVAQIKAINIFSFFKTKLRQGLVNLFCKVPDSGYFKLLDHTVCPTTTKTLI